VTPPAGQGKGKGKAARRNLLAKPDASAVSCHHSVFHIYSFNTAFIIIIIIIVVVVVVVINIIIIIVVSASVVSNLPRRVL